MRHKETAMPRFLCRRCGREFWGWGVSHLFRSGGRLVCPDCDGALVEKDERGTAPSAGGDIFDGPEAA